MTEPLDVSLRVRLAYEAGAAKMAVADIEAIRASATKLGGTGAERLTADIAGITAPAVAAKRELADMSAAAVKLGQASGGGRMASELRGVSAEAKATGRVIAETTLEAERLQAALKARRATGGFANGAELEAFLKSFGAQVRTGTARLGELVAAAAKVGTTAGPARLADGLGAVSSAATTARRELDFVGIGAVKAERDLERLGRAMRSAGGGTGGIGGGDEHGGGPGGRPHRVNPALRAAAMPFRAERKVGFLASGGGMAGLAAGYGLFEVGKAFVDAEKQAIDFESQMTDVKRAVADLSPDGIKALETAILKTSRPAVSPPASWRG
jgi:hypothetical protein